MVSSRTFIIAVYVYFTLTLAMSLYVACIFFSNIVTVKSLQHSFGNLHLFSLFPLEFWSDNVLLIVDLTLSGNIKKRKEEITVCLLI